MVHQSYTTSQPPDRPTGTGGQSLVEFALVLVLLLVIAAGVLDLGRVFHSTIVITNASREGARYLTRHPEDNSAGYTGTRNAAINEADGALITLTSANVSITCTDAVSPDGCDSGTDVVVTVDYQFAPIIGWILPEEIDLSRSTTMVVP